MTTTLTTKKYQLVEDTDEAMRILFELSNFTRIALDFETAHKPGYLEVFKYNWDWEGTGRNLRKEVKAVDARTADIRLIQVGTPNKEQYIFDMFKIPISRFKDFFESGIQLIAHHAKFEASMLRKYEILPKNWGDTMISHQLITAGLPAKHGLEDVVWEVFQVRLDKTEQSSDWSGELREAQYDYAAKDIEYLLPLWDLFYGVCQEDGLLDTLALEMRTLPALVAMEANGVYVNLQKTELLRQEYAAEMMKYAQKVMEIVQASNVTIKNNKFLNSPRQLLNACRELGFEMERLETGDRDKEGNLKYSTEDKYFSTINHPFTNNILSYRGFKKLISTYLDNFPIMKHPMTGRMHCNWMQTFTDTGRLSCSNLNLMNIPKEGSMRELFEAPPGHLLCLSDFSQIEVRLAAILSCDSIMVETLKQPGADLHAETAIKLLGAHPDDEDWEKSRSIGKQAVFSGMYGSGAEALAEKSRGRFTLAQAKEFLTTFFNHYKGFGQYLQGVRHGAVFGKKESRSILGRRRNYLPKEWEIDYITSRNAGKAKKAFLTVTEREAGNHPFQSSALDFIKSAMCEAYHVYGLEVVINCHDELLCYAKAENSEEDRYKLERSMVDGANKVIARAVKRGFKIDPSVPIVAEAKVVKSWRDK